MTAETNVFDFEKEAKMKYRCSRCKKQGTFTLWIFGLDGPNHTEYSVCKHCGCVEQEKVSSEDEGYKKLWRSDFNTNIWVDLIFKRGYRIEVRAEGFTLNVKSKQRED